MSALLRAGLAALLVLPLLSGCRGTSAADGPAPTPSGPALRHVEAAASAASPAEAAGTRLVATLRRTTDVRSTRGGPVTERLTDRTDEGSPRVLLVTEDGGDALRVSLPGRPNGRQGWVRADDVDLAATDWRLEVSLSAHRLDVYRGLMLVAQHPVGVGRAVTPTPRGTWYVTDLLSPPDASGAYGPYAFGLSAYSEVLTSFAGGKGQVGLHGTDDPAGIGHDVSHGCLRVANDVISTLARELPLGTPVVVRD